MEAIVSQKGSLSIFNLDAKKENHISKDVILFLGKY